MSQIYTQYYQGAYPPGVLCYGFIAPGMVFTPCSDGKFQGTSPFGVIGVRYTVTAVLPDPNSNGTPAEYPNDQATLTGPVDAVLWPTATATIPNTWFKNAYRTS